jgi:hypothetical protein
MNPNLPSSSNKNLPSGFLNLSKIEQNNVKKKQPRFQDFSLEGGAFSRPKQQKK